MDRAAATSRLSVRRDRGGNSAISRKSSKGAGMSRCALYDLKVDGEVWYVGITSNPSRRIAQHKASHLFPAHVSMTIVRWYTTRGAAQWAESKRIARLRPPINKRGNPIVIVDQMRAEDERRRMKYEAEFDEWQRVSDRNGEIMRALDVQIVTEMRSLLARGTAIGDVAEQYGATPSLIEKWLCEHPA